MIIDVATFNAYSGNYEDNDAQNALKEMFLESAEEIVESYLHFNPELSVYTGVYLEGNGRATIALPAHPIKEITALTVNGAAVDVANVIIEDERIRLASGVFPLGSTVVVAYSAGWSADEMPVSIKTCILRIATLMLQETGGNIGLSGKSFSDMSRTFVSYTNYEKYLQPIADLKAVKL